MPTAPALTNLRAAVSEAELRELYLAQRLTIEQIAARFGLAATTIARRFADLGIRARRRGPLPGTRHGVLLTAGQAIEWTAELAYAVGLITTDGCLSQDRRHLNLTSKDIDRLETARRCLHITARITQSINPRPIYRLQWGDLLFHRWLMEIGLMPAKSLRLGALRIPDEWLRDFLRAAASTGTARS
jgi:AraC-like DNA-binding protein